MPAQSLNIRQAPPHTRPRPQVNDGVDDPTMDWAAYTDSFTNEMHERPTIQEHKWTDRTLSLLHGHLAFNPTLSYSLVSLAVLLSC